MNKNSKFGIKEVVAIGIGTALFVVLSNVSVPFGVVPNTSLRASVAVLTFFSAVFGPIVGGAVGLIGHALGMQFSTEASGGAGYSRKRYLA